MAQRQPGGAPKGNSHKGKRSVHDKPFYEAYRRRHGGGDRKKFTQSKEHRNCGPKGYYLRAQNAEKLAAKQKKNRVSAVNTAISIGQVPGTGKHVSVAVARALVEADS